MLTMTRISQRLPLNLYKLIITVNTDNISFISPMSYIYNQRCEYSQSSLRSLNTALLELQNFYNVHFNNLNMRCMAGTITQQEFFDEQRKLSDMMNQIKELEAEITRYNESQGVKRGQLSDSEKTQIYHYYQTGNYTQTQLSQMFGVSQAAISGVLKKFG